MNQAQWPAGTLTPDALALALLAIGEPQTAADRFAPRYGAATEGLDLRAPREALLQAAATPEQRLALAGAIGCSFAELTNWVIRADLLRIDGLHPEAARALAAAGVMGVRDLAAWTRAPHRLAQLEKALSKDGPAATAGLSTSSLKVWGHSAARLPCRVIADTTVILVVKGAGVQKADETLSGFVNGFWPAVNLIDHEASLTQRDDVFPAGYRSTPYDRQPLNLVTEIQSGERRIWIKEPYWEPARTANNPFSVLSNEWRMATYALGSWINELFAEHDTRLRPTPRAKRADPWRYLMANTLLNWAILLQVWLTLMWALRADHRLGLLPSILSSSNASLILLLAGVLLGLLLAIAPMRATTQQMWDFYTGKPLHALPGMTGWFLVLLVAAFAISPWAYIAWIFFWVTLQLALLCARASAWPYRELANTDTSTDDYYSIDGDLDPDTGTPRVYKRNKHMALRRRLFALNYRYIVVLALPITFLGLMLARLLKWTRVLGNAGDVLENILNLLLSSLLGDVVDYAMDAAQASRIRHVVQADLMLFHDRADVSSLHVFAHSQGTPITFETLFHYLPAEYRRKITTYVTIGSVLSYYHQANPVLDPVYVGRFPVRPYPDFADGFQWLNFWNLVDPITEFYGLDEYHMVQAAPLLELDPDGEPNWQSDGAHNGQANRSYTASPINIKTPATVLNHSEYWSDIPLVQLPFAQRVLGDLQPPVWNPDKLKHLPRFLSHASAVILLGFIWVLLFAPAVWLVNLAWPGGAFRGPFATLIFQSIAGLVPRLPDWLTGVAGWVAEFLAEFAAILVTGAIYFGIIVGLVVGVRLVTNRLVSMWPHRKPKANATAPSAHPRS